jgi:hypothetical protein
MADAKTTLNPFDGKHTSDFMIWELRIIAALKCKGLLHCVEKTYSVSGIPPNRPPNELESEKSFTLRRHFITFHTAYERERTTYGHPPEGVIHNDPRGVFRGLLEKLVANPDNGHVLVFQNTVPESVMPVLQNDPGPFWRSLCPF